MSNHCWICNTDDGTTVECINLTFLIAALAPAGFAVNVHPSCANEFDQVGLGNPDVRRGLMCDALPMLNGKAKGRGRHGRKRKG